MKEVERAVERALRFPEGAPMLDAPVRRAILRRFPYSVLYYVRTGEVVIVAVMHHKRQPGYWEDRLA